MSGASGTLPLQPDPDDRRGIEREEPVSVEDAVALAALPEGAIRSMPGWRHSPLLELSDLELARWEPKSRPCWQLATETPRSSFTKPRLVRHSSGTWTEPSPDFQLTAPTSSWPRSHPLTARAAQPPQVSQL